MHTAVVQIVWNVKCCVTYAAVRGEGQQVANLSHIKFFRSGTLKLTECTRVQNYTGTAAATIITSTIQPQTDTSEISTATSIFRSSQKQRKTKHRQTSRASTAPTGGGNPAKCESQTTEANFGMAVYYRSLLELRKIMVSAPSSESLLCLAVITIFAVEKTRAEAAEVACIDR